MTSTVHKIIFVAWIKSPLCLSYCGFYIANRALVPDVSALIVHHRNLIKLPSNQQNTIASVIQCWFPGVNKLLHCSFHYRSFGMVFFSKNTYILIQKAVTFLSILHHLKQLRPRFQQLYMLIMRLVRVRNSCCELVVLQCHAKWSHVARTVTQIMKNPSSPVIVL